MSCPSQVMVSVGRGVTFKNPFTLSLQALYQATRDGILVDPNGISHEINKPIELMRWAKQKGDNLQVKHIKQGLLACTLSGVFPGGRRQKANIIHSGRLQIDIDNLGFEAAKVTKTELQTDRHIEWASISPREEGVKASILIPPCKTHDEHKAAFVIVQRYILDIYGVKIDSTTSDVTRLMFLPYDKEAFISNTPRFTLDVNTFTSKKNLARTKTERINKNLQPNLTKAEKKLREACHSIRTAPDGQRHQTRRDRACQIGNLVNQGLLDEEKARSSLLEAARSNTSNIKSVERTIDDGLNYGKANLVNSPIDFEPHKDTQTQTIRINQNTLEPSLYEFNEKGTWRWVGTNEDRKLRLVANFWAQIVEELWFDNGEKRELYYRIQAKHKLKNYPEVTIPAQHFSSLDFVSKNYGSSAQIFPGSGNKEYMRHAIQVNSEEASEKLVFSHTGWRQINEELAYLSSSGALDRDCVEVQLDKGQDQKLNRYALPNVSTPDEVKAGIEASLSFFELAPDKISIPLWVAPYAASISSWFEDNFASLYLVGPSGSRKTALAVLALCHFGNFTANNLYTFNDSTNSLEKASFILKDAPMLIDDFYPTTITKDQKRMISTFESITRSAGNRSGRGRMNKDLGLRSAFYPRGMAWFTGEDLIGASSALARLTFVKIEPNLIDLIKLGELQDKRQLLPHAMADFLRWFRDNRNKMSDRLKNKYHQETIFRQSNNISHGRLCSQTNQWLNMVDLLCVWLIDRQVFTNDNANSLMENAWDAFTKNAKQLQERIRNNTPTEQFTEAIQALYLAEKLWIKSWNGPTEDKPPTRDFLGWKKDTYIYAQPETVWTLIQKHFYQSCNSFPVGKSTLWEHLARDGVLELQGKSTTESLKIPAEGRNVRVMKLYSDKLFGTKC